MQLQGAMESFLNCPSLLLAACVAIVYIIAGAFRRCFLSPIAPYPGPTLAALTFWYEFYYDVLRKGRYTWKIQELHKRYGPVVRINPHELHISDPTFYDSVYVGPARRTEKWDYSARMFGTSLAAVGTTGHELHRLRRSALNGFFSKRSILKLELTIKRVVEHGCRRLECRGVNGCTIDLRSFFAAFSADVIGEVAFGSGYGLLDKPGFEPGWQKLMMDLSRATHLMKQFPWAYTILNSIPPFLVSLVHPLTKHLFDIRNDIHLKIEQTTALLKETDRKNATGESDHPTILDSILSSSALPALELTTTRLEDEAFTLLGAGTITTAHTLTTILYYILATPTIKHRLEAELSELHATSSHNMTTLDLKSLEHRPYLSAVISEGLRLSFGVSHRLPRISPDTPLHYRSIMNGKEYNYTIPPGIPVSMTQMLTHLDSGIYSSPRSFDPDRWLPSACVTDAEKEALRLRKQHFVPFSKGTRMCAGMHLAYSELYLMLGALFAPDGVGRRMGLFETSVEDVECAHDFFNPSPKLSSKGMRVILERN
ncbi:putative P450 monooxygenase [Byssothecium circinans]|uniref:Putative P450 monooxygenase n=1 Tax=Byssothecium circinans TaxID=147558 RepID=A0A6A5TAF1_9PLEO|nr:putative P450 monooxygenase [Byssothecium circinans]